MRYRAMMFTLQRYESMAILFLVVLLTLGISALCSLFEATLYSTRMGALEAASSGGQLGHLAKRLISMKRQIDVPIAAILILNTIANTAGATIAGMYAAEILAPQFAIPFSILFTLGILFLAEILPKTLGAVYWRRIWPFIVWPLTMIRYALQPALIITQAFTRILTRGQSIPPVTEDEIIAMARLGAQAGEISPEESVMVRNIIELENKSVRNIMTPRPVMFSLDANMTVAEALPQVSATGFTRIPIYEEDREHIVGYVVFQELSAARTSNLAHTPLHRFAKTISFISETVNCLTLLTTFLKFRRHIAIVSDEYGGVAGLVTLEDLIETLLGTEIVDETDRVVDLQQSARQHRHNPYASGDR
jgi:CBS domain containing-hemolysin-like protein